MAKLKTTNVKGKMLVSDLGSSWDGASPAITLAIGDSDTGFKATGDGSTEYWSNNKAQYNMKNVYHTGRKPSLTDLGAFGKQGEIGPSTNWNDIKTPGTYKVQIATWGSTSLNGPNSFISGIYTYGILNVYQSNVASEERTVQVYYPHRNDSSSPVVTRMLNGGTWNSWSKIGRGIDKSDVGLSNVNNWGASSDKAHNSTSTYATTNMVAQVRAEKANTSHGNHVPGTQTANNAVYLRNDNKWATVTPGNIGAVNKAGDTLTGQITTASTGIKIPTTGSSWIAGKTTNTGLIFTNNSSGSYHPFVRYDMNTGDVGNIGSLGTKIGFWGYKKATTANQTDANAYLDVANNTFYSGNFSGGGSGLTSLNASNISSGTINPSRLPLATTGAHGAMSNTDKSKLDGIATGANKYSHPTGAGNNHIPSGGASNQYLKYSASGTAVWSGLPGASTSAQGIVQLNNATNSTSTSQAATAAAVKAAYDKANHSHPYAASSHTHSLSNITDYNNGVLTVKGTRSENLIQFGSNTGKRVGAFGKTNPNSDNCNLLCDAGAFYLWTTGHIELDSSNYTVIKAKTDIWLRSGYKNEPDGFAYDQWGYIRPAASGSRMEIGSSDKPFLKMYAGSWGTTSDVRVKKDISYLDDKDMLPSENNNRFYNFIKDEFKPATFKRIGEQEKNLEKIQRGLLEQSEEELTQLGFIAQDLLDSEVGSLILNNQNSFEANSETLNFDLVSYITTIGAALKESIAINEKLAERVKTLEEAIL